MPSWVINLKSTLKSKRFWLTSLRDITLIGIALFFIASYLQRDMRKGAAVPIEAHSITNKPISLFTSTSVEMKQQSNSLSISNKPTLVYFWGTWCPICQVTSPMVNSVSSDQDYQVISIAVASGTDAEITTFMQQHDYRFEVINQQNQPQAISLSQQWGAMALPAIYIIDTNNNIRFVTSGVTSSWGMSLRLWLATW
ncbi:protein disulfide oxidoreductase [Shewanella vesiculosa]|uniref:protein disulfide oxidoreductase n=1 Tax=Shewanella vesiculosa TaxID=518738 RepID=UPI000F4F8366|nr:redoxin domain-containing protein [Shewanella vesiculosa]RPA51142.1 protein disulfide oxidoreductase [Shewanella vesiculosa]UJL43028.1 redoxin family protein [Shewanella vesiculosa]